MTDDAKPANSDVVDDAINAAAGTRKTAAWLAGALGGIPSLAVLGALVREPAQNGFNAWLLALGISFAVLGAVIGIFKFANVMRPVEVSDEHLKGKRIVDRIPGHPFTTYDELLDRLKVAQAELWSRTYVLSDSVIAAKRADAVAARSLAASKETEQRADAEPGSEDLKQAAKAAKLESDAAQANANAAAAQAAALAESEGLLRRQVDTAERVRSDAFRLYASDVVRGRYEAAQVFAVAAAVVIAIGVFCLAMAPRPT